MQAKEVVILIDSDANAGAESGAASGEAQQIEGERLAAEAEKVSKILCSKNGCIKKAMTDDTALFCVHGQCKRCSYLDCNNLNRKGVFV